MAIKVILERKKKKKDPVGDEIGKLMDKGKPHDQAVAIALSMEERGDLKEEEQLDEKRKKRKKSKKKKKKGKKDACYHKVRARYDVWPSAYASGALVKCRKVGAKNWGNSTKEGIEDDIELIDEENDGGINFL